MLSRTEVGLLGMAGMEMPQNGLAENNILQACAWLDLLPF